jgi:hypothetical protein
LPRGGIILTIFASAAMYVIDKDDSPSWLAIDTDQAIRLILSAILVLLLFLVDVGHSQVTCADVDHNELGTHI